MSKWIPSWSYVPIDYNQEAVIYENVTQKAVFRNNLAGDKVRLKLCNLYHEAELTIDHVALEIRNRVTGKKSQRLTVTYRGAEKILLPANTEDYSDEITYEISAEDDFIVWMYFKEKTVMGTACVAYTGHSWQSMNFTGDFTETEALGFTMKAQIAPPLAMDPYPNQFVAGLSSICVHTADDAQLIALFGDSITHMSYYSDALIDHLYEKFPGKYAVINGGICGNRILRSYPPAEMMPGKGHQFGIAGKDRFIRDMYDDAAPDLVFVLMGVNDCSHSIVFQEETIPTAEDIFGALEDVIRQAKEKGSKVYVSTIMPFGSFGAPWRDTVEEKRCQYNELIRTQNSADDWIDLDAVMRDPDDVHRMQEGMHLGDGVHPGWFGGRKMAAAMIEKWF